MKKMYLLITVFILSLLSRSIEAQSIPTNDNCNTAILLTPSGDNSFNGATGTLTNATTSNNKDCDNKPTYDVWYKFKTTAKYHRIIIKHADLPALTRLQLYTGNCSGFNNLACVLNSNDSTVYDATDLTIGKIYFIKVYSSTAITVQNNFDIGVVTPHLIIDKSLNFLTNGDFENPVQPIVNWDNGVGPTFNGWAMLAGNNNIGIVRVDGTVDMASPDTASDGQQYVDMPGFDDTLYQNFTLTNTSSIFFSGHFSNQWITDPNYQNYTAYCAIENANGSIIAKSNVMNFNNSIGLKSWYKLSGIAYNLPPGNYRFEAFVANYSDFDNAFVQIIPTISIADKSITEGNVGTTELKLKVSLSSVSANTVTVNYTTADSTATAGSDYITSSGIIKFSPGQTSKTITTLVNGDLQIENNEKLKVILSNPVNTTVIDGVGIGTIRNDDATVFATDGAEKNMEEAVTKNINIKISPNPAKNQITVSGISAGAVNYLELVDVNGNSLLQRKVLNAYETFDVSKYASGTYVILYFDGNKTQQLKFIKE